MRRAILLCSIFLAFCRIFVYITDYNGIIWTTPTTSRLRSLREVTGTDWSRPVSARKLDNAKLKHYMQFNLSSSLNGNNFSTTVKVSEGKLLLSLALANITNGRDIVFFTGQRVKQIFDTANPAPHILLNRKLGVSNWNQFAEKLKEKFQNSTQAVAHIHNEEKIGDVLLMILEIYKKKLKIKLPRPEAPIEIDATVFLDILNQVPFPMVITNTADENWGYFSSSLVFSLVSLFICFSNLCFSLVIGTRTTKWINMTNHLRLHYSNYETLKLFLNSDKVTNCAFFNETNLRFFR
jgi:hypothetical protein